MIKALSTVKPSSEQISQLLTLKRHERPPEGYMEDFLREFHQRQREQALEARGLSAWWGRVRHGLGEAGAVRWLYGGGLAYAAILLAFVLAPRGQEVEPLPVKGANFEVLVPANESTDEQLETLDLRESSESVRGEREF